MKFRVKMTLCMTCLMSLALGVCGSLLISMSFSDAVEHEKAAAYSSYQMVRNTLVVVNSVQELPDYSDMTYTLEQLSARTASSWSALRLASADASVYSEGRTAALADMRARVDLETCVMSYIDDGDARCLQLSGAVAAGKDTLYLEMSRDISSIFATREAQLKTYRELFAVIIPAGAVLSYTISYLLTRPLSRLSRASKRIAAGNLAYRARPASHDEIGALTDDFNNMARKLEDMVSELKDAMERRERFMGSFAHELKTPMTSVIGYADLIRGGTLTEEEQVEAAGYILSEGKRLEALSLTLLDMLVLKKGSTDFAPVSPAQLAAGLAEHLKPVYQKLNIQLQYRGQEGLCLLEADLVKSLLVNLIDNARKAMDNGGNIYITTKMLEDGCSISVLDNGRGIPPESLQYLTDAFYRVDKSRSRAQGGAGLGLALCREIVELHNGEMFFESRVGNGTTVTVNLRGGRP